MKKIFTVLLGTLLLAQLYIPALATTKEFSDSYLTVTRKTRHLHSRLSKNYTGYEYIIRSTKTPVKIVTVSIQDDVSGKTAYREVKRTGAKVAAEALAWGTEFALPTITLSLFGSIIASPFIVIGNIAGNTGAKMEAKRYDKSKLADGTPVYDYEVIFRAIAAHHIRPVVTVLYRNPETRELEKLICN